MFDTCEEALAVLGKRMDSRGIDLKKARDYSNGRAPLPEMGDNLRESWIAFQRKARSDFGGLANTSLCNRIVPLDIQIGNDDAGQALATARRIWRDNRLDIAVPEAIRDCMDTGIGYLVIGRDGESGESVVTRERPESFIAATDPVRPWRTRAALKAWRDEDAKVDYAQAWIQGQAQLFVRDACTISGTWFDSIVDVRMPMGSGWVAASDPESFDGRPPVVVLRRPAPFLEQHYDLIDRLNLGKLQRLVTTAMQAYRQRAIKGGLVDKDADGNAIDWSKVFDPAPGALWDLPEGIDIWESQVTDITPMLDGEKSDAREFSAMTGTPLPDILPDSANQSAEGAATAKEKQIFQAGHEIKRLSPGIAVAIVHALRVEGIDLAGQTVEVLWAPPEHVSMSEKFAAAAQGKAAGLPVKYLMRSILGMSADQIDQAMADLADERAMSGTSAA